MNLPNVLNLRMDCIIIIEANLQYNYFIVSKTTLNGTLYFVENGIVSWSTRLISKYDELYT